jgi:hypothetical protein
MSREVAEMAAMISKEAVLPQLDRVERKIRRVEGFAVRILWPSQRDVRSDKTGVPSYAFERAAKDDFTVTAWKNQRFCPSYPGYDVEVLDNVGRTVAGNTKLETVRKTYR